MATRILDMMHSTHVDQGRPTDQGSYDVHLFLQQLVGYRLPTIEQVDP